MIFGQLFFGFAESTNSGSMTGDVPLRTCSFIHDCSVKKCAVFLVVHFKSGIDLVFLSIKKQIHLYMIVPWKNVQFFLVVHFKSGIDFVFYRWKNKFIYTWLFREKVYSFFSCSLQIRHWFCFFIDKKQIHLYMIVPWKHVQFFSCSLQFRHWFCFLSMKKQIHLYIFIHDCSVKKCAVFLSCSLQILLANSEFIISKFTYSSKHLLRQYLELFFWV